MNIAYLVVTYKDPQLLLRTVNALEGSGDFFVFVDKKTNIKPYLELFKNYKNVVFISKRYCVAWGGWTLGKSNLDLLVRAFEDEKKYDRFVLLTGLDYPLFSNKRIIETFEKNSDVEYVMAYNIAKSPYISDHHKITKNWFFDFPFKNRFITRCYRYFMYRIFTRPFSPNKLQVKLNGKWVDPYFGQTLAAFTREGAELVINTYKNDKAFNRRMRRVHAPDESYWQTIIFNSHLRCKTVEKGNDHICDGHFGWAPLHYHTYDDYTSVFTDVSDFDTLINSGYMFCRKVLSDKSKELLDKIDEYRSQEDSK